jgi:signal transduction histidine kinase
MDENNNLLETVDDISNSCQIALSILNDLLTFDKIDSGQMKMELEETHPWLYLNGAVKPFNAQARLNNVVFTVACEGTDIGWTHLYSIQIDQHKMSQVLRNLVSNALKFTQEGGSVAVVATHYTVQIESPEPPKWRQTSVGPEIHTGTGGSVPADLLVGHMLRIEVRDTGAGISRENQVISLSISLSLSLFLSLSLSLSLCLSLPLSLSLSLSLSPSLSLSVTTLLFRLYYLFLLCTYCDAMSQ